MTALLVALVLAQFPTPFTVKDEGVPKGTATGVNCTGAGVTCSVGVGGVWTLDAAAGGGGGAPTTVPYWTGAADGTLSTEHNLGALATGLVLNTAGTPSIYGGGTCTAPNFVRVISASGVVTCAAPTIALSSVTNPTGDWTATFPSGSKTLWEFSGATDYAFSIHGTGAFTGGGDLVHLHLQGTPGVTAGADVLHVEWEDVDATGLRLNGPSSASPAMVATGTVNVTGVVTASGFSGPLTGAVTGNASTATALAADGADCVGAGEFAKGVTAAGVASGCAVPPGTYTLPDAAAATKGGILLTGDLGGTASSPAVVDDSHAHTTTTISGLDAANDISSGVLAGARGGGGAALPTCSGTDKLTANGTTWSCAADQTSAGGGYATVQDEGTGLTARTTLNFAGAGVSCADDITRTTCTIAGGGGGSPAGSTGQVQYNDAGAFSASVDLSYSTANRTAYVGIGVEKERQTTHPASPAAGRLKSYAFGHHGTNSPAVPQLVDGQTSLEFHPLPMSLAIDDRWGCAMPAGFGSTVVNSTGGTTAAVTGTAAAVAWAVTDERTRHTFIQYPTTAAVNLNAGVRANADLVWRGNAADIGGFYVWGTMNIVTANAGQRVFMGLKDATAVLTATADPNAALDTVYFGCNAADTNLSICSNDATTTATCTTLGANFPCKTANTAYDWAFWAAPNASSINYYIRRLVNGSTAEGTVSTDLPRNTVALGWDMTINSGTSASITTMQFGGACFIGNP